MSSPTSSERARSAGTTSADCAAGERNRADELAELASPEAMPRIQKIVLIAAVIIIVVAVLYYNIKLSR